MTECRTSIEDEQEQGVRKSIAEDVDGFGSRMARSVEESILGVEVEVWVALVGSRRLAMVGMKSLRRAMQQGILVTVARRKEAVACTRVQELHRRVSSSAALDDMIVTLMVEVVAEEVLGRLASPGLAEALSNVGGQVVVVWLVFLHDRYSDLKSVHLLWIVVALLRRTPSNCSASVAQLPLSDFSIVFFAEEASLDFVVCSGICCPRSLVSSCLRLHLCRLSAGSSPILTQATSPYSPK